MSAEELVTDIINQALAVGQAKSTEATNFSNQAATAASGFAYFSPTSITFSPASNVEPPVNIPVNATGLDNALYNSSYDKIVQDLTGKFNAFFAEFFPDECDYLAEAQTKLCEMLDGGSGIPAAVEDQIWQRDRSRVLADAKRMGDEIVATYASRGFPLPPGAASHAIFLAQQQANDKNAQASRDTAIKHIDILVENARFAIQNALDYRVKGIAAAGDYIKVIALGPEIAMKLATSAAGAQAQLISAASTYYRNRIAVEELKLDVLKFNANERNDAGKNDVREFSQRLQAKTATLSAAARAAGDQAAAALNAVHASAQIAVQGEAA